MKPLLIVSALLTSPAATPAAGAAGVGAPGATQPKASTIKAQPKAAKAARPSGWCEEDCGTPIPRVDKANERQPAKLRPSAQ